MQKLNVVLCWHLHQPQYRDHVTGQHVRPWAYLHGLKDYVDMAVHLESVPEACAVVNFSPVLLEQLDDYSTNLAAHLRDGTAVRDRILALLTPAGIPDDRQRWPELARACLRAHRENQVERFPAFAALAAGLRPMLEHEPAAIPSRQQLVDIAVWYHLAWCGESVRRGDPRVQALMRRESGFNEDDCRQLIECVADVLAGLVPRYRRLAGSGQVELSVSPWGHPNLPLMFDFRAALQADPGIELPRAEPYPGGADRGRWHLARAIQVFSRSFGLRPRGCWPADGAVCPQTIALLDAFGFDWVASSESVLRRSLDAAGAATPDAAALASAYRLPGQRAACFFRDDRLAELPGFSYAGQDGEQAAADLAHRLDAIAGSIKDRGRHAVALVMDGQNAWEYYPDNGHAFLQALYRGLARHPRLRLTTFARCLLQDIEVRALPTLVPGSWVGGSLGTWIGNPDRNEAWRMLCEAKELYDQVVVEGALDDAGQAAAEEQLGVLEGSDWFWWLDDDNPPESMDSFDRLFRRHLRNLYQLLQEPAPAELMPDNVRQRAAG